MSISRLVNFGQLSIGWLVIRQTPVAVAETYVTRGMVRIVGKPFFPVPDPSARRCR
ncbi:MAG: hypothetical protein O2945_04370 [Planctomycetota bacterium]|nr:hypothetical protein [Planctomycetota bacterium]